MGRVQGGARAAFATPSWGPARITYFFKYLKNLGIGRQAFFLYLRRKFKQAQILRRMNLNFA